MSMLLRRALPLVLLAALTACGKKQDASVPLAYAPADTPYVFANIDPLPQAVRDQYFSSLKPMWPAVLGTYTRLIDDAKDLTDEQRKVARAILDEFGAFAEKGSAAEAGFTGEARFALYGVGLVPVARWEIADADKLRATVARVEAKAGAKLAVAKIGEQEYWHVGNDKVVAIFAIVGKHLVATIAPPAATDDLRKRLLGLAPPDKSLLDAGALDAINRDNKFTPYGTVLVDIVRIVDVATGEPDATMREFTTALGSPPTPTDPTCRKEFLEIANKYPRVVAGYTKLEPKTMDMVALLQLEPALAKDVAAAVGSAPGSAGQADGLFDVSLSLPVLKLKDFWIKQTKAVVDKPYACAQLDDLNRTFTEMNQKLATTIPPPVSDLTGARVTLTKLAMGKEGAKPDLSGKLLIGLTNPMSALAMGQLAIPQLKEVKLTPDGSTVALPPGLVPGDVPPLFAAMNDKAIALAAGQGEDAALGAYLTAPASTDPVFMRMYFTGSMYGQFGGWVQKMRDFLPEAQRKDLDDQSTLFKFYEQWIRYIDIKATAKSNGLEFFERVELN